MDLLERLTVLINSSVSDITTEFSPFHFQIQVYTTLIYFFGGRREGGESQLRWSLHFNIVRSTEATLCHVPELIGSLSFHEAAVVCYYRVRFCGVKLMAAFK